MKVKAAATVEDLRRVEGKAELIRGELVLMQATGGLPSYAAAEVFSSLRSHCRRKRKGYAITDNAGFLVHLPHRESFSPDAAYTLSRPTMKFFEGAPIFAAEVRSAEDYGPSAELQIAAKRDDYFAAGTLVVWDVDLLGEDVVRVYRAAESQRPTVYRRGETAEAEPAVPGWKMDVDLLFP